jgi:Tfp pilus assembly protein FimT
VALMWLFGGKEDEKGEKRLRWGGSAVALVACLGVGLLVLPALLGWMNGQSWEASQEQINGYMRVGMTRARAVEQIQKMKMAQMQADATRDAGASVAAAIASRK